MNTVSQVRLIEALESCLRPLVRMLLRSGVTYRQFAELAKLAFVQEALREHDAKGKTTNLSRVAVRTDLSRKEVSRLQKRISESRQLRPVATGPEYYTGQAARVLQLWYTDTRFSDSHGKPRELPFGGESLSFSMLVRAAGGDVPPGAVRAELCAADAVHETPDAMLKPTKRYYVPADVGEDLLVGITHFVVPVLAGLERNTGQDRALPFIQRLAYSDRLTASTRIQFREVARERSSAFLQDVDDWLSAQEDASDDTSVTLGRVGVGVFYFESDKPPDL
jgi:hypothetical protein